MLVNDQILLVVYDLSLCVCVVSSPENMVLRLRLSLLYMINSSVINIYMKKEYRYGNEEKVNFNTSLGFRRKGYPFCCCSEKCLL